MTLDSLFLFNFTTISTYFTPVDIDIVPSRFVHIIGDLVSAIGNIGETVSANTLCPIIFFTELQTILLTIFLVIFSINLALIGFYWQKYGGVITDRFIRQSKLKINCCFVFFFFIVVAFFHIDLEIWLSFVCLVLLRCEHYLFKFCRIFSFCYIFLVGMTLFYFEFVFLLSISGTLKEIEELKLSVAKLKLPIEHTPRI